jgi:cation diffusion facilitator CzcD-associated flavoprotein CzcO
MLTRLQIYDKNPVVSGTWHENSYPGCACDVPAHNYTYSFDPKHDWSSVYAGSSEIKAYFQGFCDKHNLEKYIKTSHLVDHARWDGESGEWEIEVLNTIEGARFRDRCHILVYATGYLNNWAWPEVAGKDMFQGGLVHSANWDQDIELKGKKVALIGSG